MNFNKVLFVVLITLTLIISACSNDDDNNMPNNNNVTLVSVTEAMIVGDWQISEYNDSGTDETSDFAGYTFEFFDDGSVRANNGTITLDGIWSVTTSSSDGDDSTIDLDFNMFFAVAEDHDFDDLNDNWDIMASSDSSLSLRDISGGDGSTDRLVFVKN